MRLYITGKHREVVWPNWFKTHRAAERYRKLWGWGRGCKVVR